MQDTQFLTEQLLARNLEIERADYLTRTGRSLSGWQCSNPYASEINAIIETSRDTLPPSEYLYAEAFPGIETSLKKVTNIASPDKSILLGQSATALITTVAAWISQRGFKEVRFLAPIYFTALKSLKLFGVPCRTVNRFHAFEKDFRFALPKQIKSVLWITDPIWYAGIRYNDEFWDAVLKWREATDSTIIVDRSFAGICWNESIDDSFLNDTPNTIQILSPTKQLIMHGYRAAYLVCQAELHALLHDLHEHIFGSLSLDTVAYLQAFPQLKDHGYSQKIAELAANNHKVLRCSNLIKAPWNPTDGYFVFEKVILLMLPSGTGEWMGGEYFLQDNYPGYYRVNLLSPLVADLVRHHS